MIFPRTLIVYSVLALLSGGIQAQSSASGQEPEPGARAPLLTGIGSHHRAITTRSSVAQRYFDQGLSLFYGYHYVGAVPSFQETIDADPDCAMAWWGLALTIAPNPNSRYYRAADDPKGLGLDAIRRAVELADGAAPLERALIEALHARYDAGARPDPRERDLAYVRAMREIYVAHPEDADVATLYAEAQMMLSPWQYWNPDGSGRPGGEEARRALRQAIDLDPRHPGAHHFYIHLMEDHPDPSLALTSALVLEGLMPDVGHIVHMPSHIYIQIGRYEEAINGNLASLAADKRMLEQWGDRERPWDVPSMGMGANTKGAHARRFLHLAALRRGDFDMAFEAATAVTGGVEEVIKATAKFRRQMLWSELWMTYRSFGRWQEVLEIPEMPASVPFAAAIRFAARGSAWLAKGDLEKAAEELHALETLTNTITGPRKGLFEIPLHELARLVAETRGESEESIGHLESAVRLEDSLPYYEPPVWQHPVRITLGHVLLRANRPWEAKTVFWEDLRRNPENGRALFGLWRALEALGEEQQAERVARRFREAWGGTEDPVVLGYVENAIAEDSFFDSDGIRIRYIDQGPRDGEPVVLIHGGFTNVEGQWVEPGVIDALDDVYRVIAPDLRGHGKSDKPHDPRQYGDAFVDDVIRLLDHLGIEKAHVVGYSLGGRITFRLIADHPERLISAMPNGTDGEGFSPEGLAMLEQVATSLEDSGSIRPVLDHFNSDGAMTEEQIEQIVESFRAMNDAKALAAAARSASELRPDRSKLESNRVPCLCVIGEHDTNRAALEKTIGYMANLDVEVLEGVNHVTACRGPAFVAAIKAFIGKHAASPDSGGTRGDGAR